MAAFQKAGGQVMFAISKLCPDTREGGLCEGAVIMG